MKRLEQYISLNIDRRISLDDMAAAVGLSKMHFAAQFRAMTGFRPREYLLFKRIERAKAVMMTTGCRLWKWRSPPAQWRQECRRAI